MPRPNKGLLLPYQKDWVLDKSRFKIGMMSRQSGKSFSATLEYVDDSVTRKATYVYLSSGERQAAELAEKAKTHLKAYQMVAKEFEDVFLGETGFECKKLELKLPNGSRHIFVPANPDTVRGFSGNVLWDEADIHPLNKEIWGALFPIITANKKYKLRLISTPKLQGQFKDIWDDAWDSTLNQPREGSIWSAHKLTIYDAVMRGLDVDPEELKKALRNDLLWKQEFLLEWVDEDTVLLPYSIIMAAESQAATMEYLGNMLTAAGELYLGVDIAWERHLFVIWLLEKVGDLFITRAVIRMHKPTVKEARERLFSLIPFCVRVAIDATGPGIQMAKEAKELFGLKVEGVTFNNKNKEDMAVTTKRVLEDRKFLLPAEEGVREAFHAIRVMRTPNGALRFDAESTDQGHADEFWAAALALSIAVQKSSPYQSSRRKSSRR